jgi:dienelactone hydrolase
VHYAAEDLFAGAEGITAFAETVRAAGSPIEVYTYPGSGHLFADPDGPDYDRQSAELMLERALAFVRDL